MGDLLVLLATLFWAAENVLSKHLLARISPRVLALGRVGIGSFFIFLFLLFSGQLSGLGALTGTHLRWIFVPSFFLFGYMLTWYSGLRHLKVSVATAVLLLGGPITALLSFGFSGASFAPGQILGLVLLFAGVLVSSRFYELIRS
jgi:drug/metabolite transporter (DMT)-like permease